MKIDVADGIATKTVNLPSDPADQSLTMMKSLLILSLLFASVLNADMPRYECRTRTVAPGERCWVWFPKHTNPYAGNNQMLGIDLPAGWKLEYPANYNSNQQWALNRAWCITVPADAEPGDYVLPFYQTNGITITPTQPLTPAADATPLTITVIAPAPVREWRVACVGCSADSVSSLLAEGFNVELPPGLYHWSRPVTVPDGAAIRSAGAHIVRLNDASWHDHVFYPLGRFSLEGITIEHDRSCDMSYGAVLHYWGPTGRPAGPQSPHVTIRRCTLIGSALAKSTEANVLIEDCDFVRGAGTDILPENFVMLGCTFTGPTKPGLHAWLSWGCQGALCCSTAFRGTARGPVLQVGGGEGMCFLDLRATEIYGVENNSGEVVLFESEQPWKNCSVWDLFAYDCMGPGINFVGDKLSDILVYGADLHCQKRSVILQAVRQDGTPAAISDIEFVNVECTSNWLLYGSLNNIKLANVQWLDRGPDGRGNDSGPYPQNALNINPVSMFPFAVHPSAMLGTGWTFQNCAVIARDNGYREVRSYTPWQVTVASSTPVLVEHIPVQWHPNPAADPYGPEGKHVYVCQVETTAMRLDAAGKYKKAHWVKRFMARNNGLWNTTPQVIVEGMSTLYQHREDEDWDVRIKGENGGIGVYATIGEHEPGERVQFYDTKVSVQRIPGPTYPE